jgi:hypothetical protein
MIRESALSPALILFARAIRSAKHARAIVAGVDLTRPPRDRFDTFTLAFLAALRPALEAHGGDMLAIRAALPADRRSAFDLAELLDPELLERAEPTRLLIDVINDGYARRWRMPAAAAVVQEKPKRKRSSMVDHALASVAAA